MKTKKKVTKGNKKLIKSTQKRTELSKKAMLIALSKSLGRVGEACKKVKINRKTHYEWLKKDIDYSEQVDDINEATIEFVESKLFQKINGIQIGKATKNGLEIYDVPPSDTAITFYLKTKGKHKGYIEKTEQVIEHKGDIKLDIDKLIKATRDGQGT